jgi:hypothetical protein
MLTRAEAIAHHGVLVVVIHAKLLQVAQVSRLCGAVLLLVKRVCR